LKNILWLSTFRGKWLHGPSPEYSAMFDISSNQIKNIFGRPKQVETGINAVHQSGDLTGIPLPSIDHKFWDELRYLSDEKGNSKPNNISYMNKMHYHLIDLMLLNYFRCLILSKVFDVKDEEDRREKIKDYWYQFENINKVDFKEESITEIYGWKKWFDRISTRGFNPSDIYNPLSVKSSSNENLSNDPFSTYLDGENDEPHKNNYEVEMTKWKEAINEWMNFINEKYYDDPSLTKVSDSEE